LFLQRREKTYYLRARVPLDLAKIIGKAEVKQSLRTASHKEAKSVARLKTARLEAVFSKLRLGAEIMNEADLKRLADRLLADFLDPVEQSRQMGREVEQLAPDKLPEGFSHGNGMSYAGYFALQRSLSADKTIGDLDQVAAYHQSRIDTLRQELRLNQFSEHTRQTAKRLSKAHKLSVTIPPDSWFLPPWVTAADQGEYTKKPVVSTWNDKHPEFMAVCRVVVQSQLEGHEIELERVNGHYSTERQVQAEKRIMAANRRYTLNNLWNSYRKKREAEDSCDRTSIEKYEGFITALNKIYGSEYDWSSFEEGDNATELLKELRKYKSARTKRVWSPATINDCLTFLASLYNHAIDSKNLYGITYNPFKKRQVAETSKRKEAFTSEELQLIWKRLSEIRKEEDKFWVVLIMLYTGCRIGEVCQLRLDDFEKIDGKWVVHFRHNPELGQKIKSARAKKRKRPNENVDRITALHPDLKKLGLLKYVEGLKASKEDKLFPYDHPVSGRSGVLMAKKMKTFFKQCGMPDRSAHICRHTFVTWYKQNVNLTFADASLISAMIGHEDESVHGGNKITWDVYGGGHLVKQMYDVIRKLDYGFTIV